MQMVQCKCHSCGSELNLDLDNLQAYCPACGSKLLIDMDMLGQIMIEREKTNRYKVEKDTEIELQKIRHKESITTALALFAPITLLILFGSITLIILALTGSLD